jgi:hypothetical protein
MRGSDGVRAMGGGVCVTTAVSTGVGFTQVVLRVLWSI